LWTWIVFLFVFTIGFLWCVLAADATVGPVSPDVRAYAPAARATISPIETITAERLFMAISSLRIGLYVSSR
jgi:hypothetical protein